MLFVENLSQLIKIPISLKHAGRKGFDPSATNYMRLNFPST